MLKQCQYKTNPVGYYLLKNCPSLSLHFLYCTLYFEGVIEEARHPSLAKPWTPGSSSMFGAMYNAWESWVHKNACGLLQVALSCHVGVGWSVFLPDGFPVPEEYILQLIKLWLHSDV